MIYKLTKSHLLIGYCSLVTRAKVKGEGSQAHSLHSLVAEDYR